jgi:dual specificity phosphatase 12
LTSDHTGRSATIIAAYLMYSLKLDPESAIDMIRIVRPIVE